MLLEEVPGVGGVGPSQPIAAVAAAPHGIESAGGIVDEPPHVDVQPARVQVEAAPVGHDRLACGPQRPAELGQLDRQPWTQP